MKRLVLAIVTVIFLLPQITGCVIRYKASETDSESSSESSKYDLPVILTDNYRVAGDYIVKDIYEGGTDGIEIVLYIGEETEVAVPAEVEELPVISVGNAAFSDQKKVRSITVPAGVKSIGDNAFSNCRELLSIEIPDSVVKIGKRAFADCVKLKSFRIPKKISVIDEYTFCNCYVIERITLPSGITNIEKGAFFNCAKLTGVMLPKNLKTIETDGFYNCFKLKLIKLPDSLEHLGNRVFKGCFNLKGIFFKGSVYTVFLGDDNYDHTELISAVNGESEDDDEEVNEKQ